MNKILGIAIGICIATSGYAMDEGIPAKKLVKAAKKENKDKLVALIEAKADVNAAHKRGWTALMEAAYRGHVGHVDALIAARADVNKPNKYGRTALHGAANYGHLNCVQSLIAGKANVNHQIFDSSTALMMASRNGHLNCVNALIAANADVNAADLDRATILENTIRCGHLDCVNALIAAHADIGEDELWWAMEEDHPQIAERLVEVLLRKPTEQQKASIAALLRQCTRHRVCKDHKMLVIKAFLEQMYWYNRSNRTNFEHSVAGQAVLALPWDSCPIKTQLLEKYGPKK